MKWIVLVGVVFTMVVSVLAQEGEWTEGEPLPTLRSEIAATVLDGKIYVVGGLAQGDTENLGYGVLDTLEVYDPEADEWEELSPLPIALHHTTTAAADGRIFVSGGYDDDFDLDVTDLWAYDP